FCPDIAKNVIYGDFQWCDASNYLTFKKVINLCITVRYKSFCSCCNAGNWRMRRRCCLLVPYILIHTVRLCFGRYEYIESFQEEKSCGLINYFLMQVLGRENQLNNY